MKKLHGIALALAVCVPACLSAQQAASPSSSVTPTAQEPTLAERPAPATEEGKGRMTLDVVVSDKSGNPIASLDRKNFTLFDNNQPAKIVSFRAIGGAPQDSDPPVEVTLVLDTVNVGFQQIAFARDEIGRFLRQNGGHLVKPVSIVLLTNDGVGTHLQSSTDGNALASQLSQVDSKLRTITRAQGNWGDIERFSFSLEMFGNILEDQDAKPGRKLLIWVGAGWPMLNGRAIEFNAEAQQRYFDAIAQLSTRFRESQVVLYSVSPGNLDPLASSYKEFLKGVVSVKKANPSDLALKVLATQSGGRILGPNSDLVGQINSCVSDGSTYYAISFDPPRADRANEYHDLRVQIDQPGVTATTNTGYYNQP
jgi:VWFA-related protein